MKKISTLILGLLFASKSLAQLLSVGSYVEELSRINQISGASDNLSSFIIRPINTLSFSKADSALRKLIAGKNLYPNTKSIDINLLPLNLLSEYNLNRPFGYNKGSLYPNRGLQSRFTGGIFIKTGIIQFQLKPEYVYAENRAFRTFADVQANNKSYALLNAYFAIVNGIDAPEKFGNSSLSHLYPGQSKVSINYKSLEIGVSTENLWWGPGIKNAIMMSNSAPGFLHWTFNTAKPLKTAIGSFEWQIIGGNLTQSGYLPLDTSKLVYGKGELITKPKVTRYISALTFNWQPKWVPGFYVGVTCYDYMDKDSSYRNKSIFGRLIPVITGSSKTANTMSTTSIGDRQDFADAVNFRQVLPQYKMELYFEWARNDRTANLNDFAEEPEHSSAYTVGASRMFDLAKNRFFQIKFELTHLERPPTYL